jgi:hypothetical protein
MSFTRTITVACAFAVALLGGAAAPAGSAPVASTHAARIAPVALADAAAVSQTEIAVQLTMAEMRATQGEGCWQFWMRCRINKLFKKIFKWIKTQWDWVVSSISEVLLSETQESTYDPSLPEGRVDTYVNTETNDEFYQDEVLTDTRQSETGFVFTGSTSGGGGGGSTCLTDDGCPLMY